VTALVVKAPAPQPRDGFHEFLSELNPLQYIPILGTIYRAVTGDVIPETARDVGSLVVSGLTGGPVGIAINLGTLAAEKITGIDPEKWGSAALAGVGIGTATPGPAIPPAAPAGPGHPSQTTQASTHAAPPAHAWSPAQLTAYGVRTSATGDLRRGALSGADVLNDLELARHSQEDIA
jgi:hypothetical protein